MSEWKDISTAPKDGSSILAYDADEKEVVCVYWFSKPWYSAWSLAGTNWMDGGPPYRGELTHWMPLPPPPKEAP